MRDQDRHAALGQLGKSAKYFVLGQRIERRRRLVENDELRIAQIAAGQREFLPFTAGEIDAALEAAAEHLLEPIRKALDQVDRPAAGGRGQQPLGIADLADLPGGDVFAGRQIVAHEILKDDADLLVQVFEAVFAQIHAVEQDAAASRLVKARQQLDECRLALPVFADQATRSPG